jgi:xylan 1,4-beta-xylosidase
MGSPEKPSAKQIAELESAGLLAMNGSARSIKLNNGSVSISVDLPRQAVSLLEFEWK